MSESWMETLIYIERRRWNPSYLSSGLIFDRFCAAYLSIYPLYLLGMMNLSLLKNLLSFPYQPRREGLLVLLSP